MPAHSRASPGRTTCRCRRTIRGFASLFRDKDRPRLDAFLAAHRLDDETGSWLAEAFTLGIEAERSGPDLREHSLTFGVKPFGFLSALLVATRQDRYLPILRDAGLLELDRAVRAHAGRRQPMRASLVEYLVTLLSWYSDPPGHALADELTRRVAAHP
jgi:hypothetical protein